MNQQHHSKLFNFLEKQFQDRLSDDPCNNTQILSIVFTVAEVFFLITLSHLFNLVLKRLSLPAIVSQMIVRPTSSNLLTYFSFYILNGKQLYSAFPLRSHN